MESNRYVNSENVNKASKTLSQSGDSPERIGCECKGNGGCGDT